MEQDWTFSVRPKKELQSIALPNRFAPANPFPTRQMNFQLPFQLHSKLELSNKRVDQRQVMDQAANVDGANKVQQFFSITIPLLSPVILFNLVMQMISAFQAFTQAYIIGGGTGGVLNSTLFYTLYLYIQGWTYHEMGYASAMAWVLLLIIGVFTTIIFRSSKWWVSYGVGE